MSFAAAVGPFLCVRANRATLGGADGHASRRRFSLDEPPPGAQRQFCRRNPGPPPRRVVDEASDRRKKRERVTHDDMAAAPEAANGERDASARCAVLLWSAPCALAGAREGARGGRRVVLEESAPRL